MAQKMAGRLLFVALIFSCAGPTQAQTTIQGNTAFKGPNPYTDIVAYGARPINPNVSFSTTATISAGSTSAAIGSASIFQNGDGADIIGAGVSITMSTPSAPTVTASQAAGPTESNYDVNAPPGSASFQYQIVALDAGGGWTPASSTTSVSNSNPLGIQSVSIFSLSRTNNTVTITTSVAPSLSPGAVIIVTGTSDPNANGFYVANSVAGTTVTYISGMDTRAGASTSATGGTLYWYNCNHLAWTAVTGAFQYAIYGNTNGSMKLLALSRQGETTWDDFGSNFTSNGVFPPWLPTTPPSSATADMLVTTISSGGGTTSVTLANSASNSVTNATFQFDDAPAILSAATTATTAGTASVLYIPAVTVSSGAFIVNSNLNLANLNQALHVLQAGEVYANGTIQLAGNSWWEGVPGSTISTQQFQPTPGVAFVVNGAYPGLYFTGTAGNEVENVAFTIRNQGLGILTEIGGNGFNFSLENDNFSVGSNNNNYAGMAFVEHSGYQIIFRKDLFFASTPQEVPTNTLTPLVFLRNDLANQNGPGALFCDGCYFNSLGVGVVSVPSVGGGVQYVFRNSYIQGGAIPFFMDATQNRTDWIEFDSFTCDTCAAPIVTNFASGIDKSLILNYVIGTSSGGNMPSITGLPFVAVQSTNVSLGFPGQNVNVLSLSSGNLNPQPPYNTVNSSVYSVTGVQGFMHFSAQHSLYWDLPAPGGLTATVVSGGSLSVGTTYYFTVDAEGLDGGRSLVAQSVGCIPSSGNQTCNLSWNPVSGAIAYTVYGDANSAYYAYSAGYISCENITTTTCSVTSASFDGSRVGGLVSGSGSTSINGSHIITPSIIPTTAPSTLTGTSAGTVVWSEPLQGSALKVTVLYLNGYKNTTTSAQTITFTTAYSATPAKIGSCPSGLSVSTTTATLPTSMSSAFTGQCLAVGE